MNLSLVPLGVEIPTIPDLKPVCNAGAKIMSDSAGSIDGAEAAVSSEAECKCLFLRHVSSAEHLHYRATSNTSSRALNWDTQPNTAIPPKSVRHIVTYSTSGTVPFEITEVYGHGHTFSTYTTSFFLMTFQKHKVVNGTTF